MNRNTTQPEQENLDVAAVAGASAQAKKEEGASLVEYALLVALIAVVCIVAITTLGNQVSTKFSEISSGVSSN